MATFTARRKSFVFTALLFCLILANHQAGASEDSASGFKSGLAARAYLAIIGQAAAMMINDASNLDYDSGATEWVANAVHDFDANDPVVDMDLAPEITGQIRLSGLFRRSGDFSAASPAYTLVDPTVTLLSQVTVADWDSGAWVTLDQGTAFRFDQAELTLTAGAGLPTGNLHLDVGHHLEPLALSVEGASPQSMQLDADLDVNVGFAFVSANTPSLADYNASVTGQLDVTWNDGWARQGEFAFAMDNRIETTDDELKCRLDGNLSTVSGLPEYNATYAVDLLEPAAGVWKQDMYAVINRNAYYYFDVLFNGRKDSVYLKPMEVKYFYSDEGTTLKSFNFDQPYPDSQYRTYSMASGMKDERTFWVMSTPPNNYKIRIQNPTDHTIVLEHYGSSLKNNERFITMSPRSDYILALTHNNININDISPLHIVSVDGSNNFVEQLTYQPTTDAGRAYLKVDLYIPRTTTSLDLKNPSYLGRIYQVWKGPKFYDGEYFIVPPFVSERWTKMDGIWPSWNLRVTWDYLWASSPKKGRAVDAGNGDVRIEPYAL